MDSGYGYGYGSVGMNLRGLRGNRPRLERKVVACTAGTDTGCAVHQANALTMHWVGGCGESESKSRQDIRSTLPKNPCSYCRIISCQ